MDQLPDERRIRHLLQQVKRADQDLVPSFDDLLRREASVHDVRSTRRLQFVAVGLAAIASIVLVWRAIPNGGDLAKRSQRIAEEHVPASPGAATHRKRLSNLDFDYLQSLVDDHFASLEETRADSMPVWSSGTESLLTMSFRVGDSKTPLPRWLLQLGEGSEHDSLPDGEGA